MEKEALWGKVVSSLCGFDPFGWMTLRPSSKNRHWFDTAKLAPVFCKFIFFFKVGYG